MQDVEMLDVDMPDVENKNKPINEQEILNTKFQLDKLPSDLLNGQHDVSVGQYLSPLDKKQLAELGNKHLFFNFKKDIKPANKEIEKFILHVAHGEKNEAEAMLERDPHLALHKATVIDYSGRTICGTGLMIAEGADDISNDPHYEEMSEMIKRHMRKLPDGKLEILKQQTMQFPDGWEEKEKQRTENDSVAVRKVINFILASKSYSECLLAVQEFKSYLNPKEVITTGKHFNPYLYTECYKLYFANYDRLDWFDGHNEHKAALIWSKVLGSIQRFFPASLAMAFCDYQLVMVVDNKKQLDRSLLINEIDGCYYPLDRESFNRLGEDYGVFHCQSCISKGKGLVVCDTGFSWGQLVEKYIKQKEEQFSENLSIDMPYLPTRLFCPTLQNSHG